MGYGECAVKCCLCRSVYQRLPSDRHGHCTGRSSGHYRRCHCSVTQFLPRRTWVHVI